MVSVRVNTLKSTPDQVKSLLKSLNIDFLSVSWCDHAFILPGADSRTVTDLYEYQQGHFYIQNLSSLKPSLLLNPQTSDLVLDMCAAPGSKTSHLAALMKNQGQIIANDLSRDRLFKLKSNLHHLGVTNVSLEKMPGQVLWKKYPEIFDKSLVDAPCSMEQVVGQTSKKAKLLSEKQKYLLRSAISATKPGGTIVYSTCSVTEVENETVVSWAVSKHPEVVLVKSERVDPSDMFEGFYIALLQKKS